MISIDKKLKARGYHVLGFTEKENTSEVIQTFLKVHKDYNQIAVFYSEDARLGESWQPEKPGYIFYGKGTRDTSRENYFTVEIKGKNIKTGEEKTISLND